MLSLIIIGTTTPDHSAVSVPSINSYGEETTLRRRSRREDELLSASLQACDGSFLDSRIMRVTAHPTYSDLI